MRSHLILLMAITTQLSVEVKRQTSQQIHSPIYNVTGRAAAELVKMILLSRLLVAFMNTAAGLLKLKSCIALVAEITTVGAGVSG